MNKFIDMSVGKKKRCTACKKFKSIDKFHKRTRCKDGLNYYCKKCQNEINNKRHQINPRKTRNDRLKNRYGITLEQYDRMFENQDGVCAICGGLNDHGRRLCVDHNHKTGKIRGLLCANCNLRISVLENKSWQSLAEEYLNDNSG